MVKVVGEPYQPSQLIRFPITTYQTFSIQRGVYQKIILNFVVNIKNKDNCKKIIYLLRKYNYNPKHNNV